MTDKAYKVGTACAYVAVELRRRRIFDCQTPASTIFNRPLSQAVLTCVYLNGLALFPPVDQIFTSVNESSAAINSIASGKRDSADLSRQR